MTEETGVIVLDHIAATEDDLERLKHEAFALAARWRAADIGQFGEPSRAGDEVSHDMHPCGLFELDQLGPTTFTL
jgi:hypothetical protein